MKRFSLRYKLVILTVVALGIWTLAAEHPFNFKAGEVISAELEERLAASTSRGD